MRRSAAPSVSRGCSSRSERRSFELSSDRACLGRLYFPVAGGIQYGRHWLNVKLKDTVLRVPFRILTKDEAKLLDKNYKSIEQQVFAPKK